MIEELIYLGENDTPAWGEGLGEVFGAGVAGVGGADDDDVFGGGVRGVGVEMDEVLEAVEEALCEEGKDGACEVDG